jgi:hypothetical protein
MFLRMRTSRQTVVWFLATLLFTIVLASFFPTQQQLVTAAAHSTPVTQMSLENHSSKLVSSKVPSMMNETTSPLSQPKFYGC